ncbi:glycosyltransferase family 90 protein [Mycena leptocephala]|nr:glycosyltransferase family 90 protein [Mycena leptocephala]
MGGSSAPHPIPGLMDAAETRFRAKVGKQSTNLAGAVAEYKKRYGRPPPRGFDQWYNFAVKHKFVMIDEFDTVVEDLAPFWNLEGQEVRDRARLVGALPSIDVVQVRGGKATTVRGGDGQWEDAEVSARAAGFRSMLGQFVKDLPDMDFTINAKAEGRVVVPWEHVAYPNLTQDASTILSPSTFRPDWAGLGSVWDAWRRTCPPTSPARRLYSAVGPGWAGLSGGKDRLAEAYREWTLGASARSDKQTVFATGTAAVGTGRAKVNKSKAGAAGEDKASAGHPGIGSGSEFAFARDTNAGLDFCNAPGAHYEQGHFFSDWRVLGALVPVFSPARSRALGTSAYTYAWDPINLEQRAVDPMEVPWEEKRDVVWWRGASTGGGSSPKGFGGGYQRHRFLRMSSSYTSPASADSNTPAYTTVPVPLAALNADVMDTAFVKAVVPVGPEHRFGNSVQLGESWRYKYLLDLDGMGYSGRFMAFLASDSVPVKATVYDEFFSEWIEPWVHYIPLSAGYAEMYNIVAYFSGPPPSALRAANLGVTSAFRGSTYRPPFAPDDDEPADEEEGDRRLRRIARAGKQWKQTIGRKVDMEVYVYRLAIEYARLWADDREAMSYHS